MAEAPEKKAPDASGAIERAQYRPGVLEAQREALPIRGPSRVNGTQAAFFALIAVLGAFFNLSWSLCSSRLYARSRFFTPAEMSA